MPTTTYNTINGRMRGQSTAGVRTDFLTDALGSVTTTTTAAGVVANTYRHKPFGQMLSKAGSDADPKYLWTGDTGSRRTLRSMNEQYNQARHYSTASSRWTSVDPLWPDESAYSYPVDPISLLDPSGLVCCKKLKQKRFTLNVWCVKADMGGHYNLGAPKDSGVINVRNHKGCSGCPMLATCPEGDTGEYTVTIVARQMGGVLQAQPIYSATGCAKPSPNPGGDALKKLVKGMIGDLLDSKGVPFGGTIGAIIDIIDEWPPAPPRGKPTVPPKYNPCKAGYLPEFKLTTWERYQCADCVFPVDPPTPIGTGFGDDYPGSCTVGPNPRYR